MKKSGGRSGICEQILAVTNPKSMIAPNLSNFEGANARGCLALQWKMFHAHVFERLCPRPGTGQVLQPSLWDRS